MDDTIYKEIDFVRSGFAAVGEALRRFGFSAVPGTENLGDDDLRSGTWINRLLVEHGAPQQLREVLLWLYRLHSPSITLDGETQTFMSWARGNCGATAIVTDGRSFTQRRKLAALGLADWPAYISEEVGAAKPNARSFQQIESRFPGMRYAYVGDNPLKDFAAPNAMGWLTVGLRDDGRNIHSQASEGLAAGCQPGAWVKNFSELKALLPVEQGGAAA